MKNAVHVSCDLFTRLKRHLENQSLEPMCMYRYNVIMYIHVVQDIHNSHVSSVQFSEKLIHSIDILLSSFLDWIRNIVNTI